MTPEQLNQIAELIAKSLEDWVPEAVDAAVEARLKELNLSENTDIKEIKAQMKELVEKSRMWTWKQDLGQVQKDFVVALKSLRDWDANAIKAMNVTTDVDGWYLVHPEFEKGVFRIMENYWIWKDCNISRMNSNTKYFILRKTWLQVFYTDEATAFNETALTYDRKEMIAKKVWAILSVTYELIEDEADPEEIWNKAQEEFAEAFAYFLDKEVLTWDWNWAHNSQIKGICNLTNVNVITLTGWATSLDSDALIDAIRKVPLKYKQNFKPAWYLSQDAIAIIEKLKDREWRPLYRTLDNWEKGFLLWYPVVLTDVMPSWSIDSDTPFIVFGALKNFALWIKRWFGFEFGYRSGWWEKDIKSLKASARVCGLALADEAFSVIKTASGNNEGTSTEPETPTVNDPEINDWNDDGDY